MSIEDYAPPKPKANFPYTMVTTAIMEHSRGIAWTANLLREGRKIGTIEQAGDGGCDRVNISDRAEYLAWNAHVMAAFDGEESATYFLLCKEEEES